MNREVKPCPFCGSLYGETISPDEDGEFFCWLCLDCKATGPLFEYNWSEEEEDYDDIPHNADIECKRLWSNRYDISNQENL